MKKTGIALLSFILILASCNSNDKAPVTTKDKYEQTKATLAETEKKNPGLFISVTSHGRKNLIGQRVIKGTLFNNAKVSSYKDVELELGFYSKTGALLEKDHETVYESLLPGTSTNFKAKYFAPRGTDSVGISVITAKVDQ